MDNNADTLLYIIQSRKSTFPKDYTENPIPDEVVDGIINSANFAPNHKKTKPWRFIVFRENEKELLALEVQRLYKEYTPHEQFLEKKYKDFYEKIGKSDTVVSISVNFSYIIPEWEEVAATAMAVQNMYLMCTAHDIGCYWSSHKITEKLHQFLDLKENQKCLGLFYMGNLK